MNAVPAARLPSPIRRALALAALGALACSASATAFAQDTARADQVRAYNAEVLKLQSELRRSANAAANGRAAEVLAAAFPGREIVPVNCRPLIWQNGSLHCVTMQLPEGLLA